jgi:hypothetical protein
MMDRFLTLQGNTGFYRKQENHVCSANLYNLGQLIHGSYTCGTDAAVDTGYANMTFFNKFDQAQPQYNIDLTLDGIKSNVPFKITLDVCINTVNVDDVCSFYVTVNNDKDGNVFLKDPYPAKRSDRHIVIPIKDKNLFTANGIYYIGICGVGGISFALSQITVDYL